MPGGHHAQHFCRRPWTSCVYLSSYGGPVPYRFCAGVRPWISCIIRQFHEESPKAHAYLYVLLFVRALDTKEKLYFADLHDEAQLSVFCLVESHTYISHRLYNFSYFVYIREASISCECFFLLPGPAQHVKNTFFTKYFVYIQHDVQFPASPL